MKDLYAVLRQKEQEIERIRSEIEALRRVIALLNNDESTDDAMDLLRSASSRTAESSASGMRDLETYYPFVRNMYRSRSIHEQIRAQRDTICPKCGRWIIPSREGSRDAHRCSEDSPE